MATETIKNPTWDDVRRGDVVTLEYGIPSVACYTCDVTEVTAKRIEDFKKNNWYVTQITREVPDPLPDSAGALAFTDRGVAHSDGDTEECWELNGAGAYREFYKTSYLPNPVEALPVPAKELRELMKYLEMGVFRSLELNEFVIATRREWKRAGIDGGLDDD